MSKRFAHMLLIVTVMMDPARVRADDAEAAKLHYAQASKYFDLGRYDDAIKEYVAAYDAKADPVLLYDIAQVHRLAGHSAEAVRFYRVYLLRVPDASNADEVHAKIAELQKAIEQQKKAQAMPPDQVKPLGPVQAPAAQSPPPVELTITKSDSSPRGRTERIAGGVLLGAAGGALIAAVSSGVVAQQQSQAIELEAQRRQPFDPSNETAGLRDQLASDVLYAVVGAATIAGVALVALGARERHSAHRALLTPTWRIPSFRGRSRSSTSLRQLPIMLLNVHT
jgi:tetratricopeptide (TPR) repeat protein